MLAEMLATLAVIGIVDYVTGYQIRLLPLYAGPIFVVSWFFDRKTALLFGLLSGGVSLAADWFGNDPDLEGWTKIWEITRHLGSCLTVALVASVLRSKHESAIMRIALLEHSQRLEREIVSISDAEQRRIGQDLHDGLCQYLAALGCSAASLRDDLKKLHLKVEADSAGELAELLQEAVVQTRDLSRGLVPAHVEQVGLVLALESLAQSVGRLQGVNCTFQFRGLARKYEERTARHLYRIAQEAINNAIRHGRAHSISISLESTKRATTLRVSDDGVGISASAPNGTGMGLSIMRYRARETGGELRIEEPKSGGTLVCCTTKISNEVSQSAAA
jgi:signal transduction histidine kinase